MHRYRLAFNDSTGERQDLIVPLPVFRLNQTLSRSQQFAES